MHRIGIDFKATLPQTILGLVGGVVTYRYFIKPVISPKQNDVSKNITNNNKTISSSESDTLLTKKNKSTTAFSAWNKGNPPTIHTLDSIDTLQRIGQGRVVLLITRGYNKKDTEQATTIFTHAIANYAEQETNNNNNPIEYYIIDDNSAQIPATTLLTRLGITHDKPFVMILDNFIVTEQKYLMTTRKIPTEKEIIKFMNDYQYKRIQPALLGQERPPHDRSPNCKDLVEVVTDSFVELVLDPSTDVLFESYTKSCDACRAFAPRYRMLAQLSSKYLPKLRVASMDIRDNDRDIRYLPEKWTPAIRLFPAIDTKTKDNNSSTQDNKTSILLNYADDPAKISAANSSSNPDTNSTGTSKVYLPTLPELLTFVTENTQGRLPISSEFMQAATIAEEDASMLESAYDQTLQYMRLWQAYNTMLDDIEEEVKGKGKDKDTNINFNIQKKRQTSEKMKSMVIDTYSFIVDKAALGGLDTALTKLDQIANFVDKKDISREISVATTNPEQLLQTMHKPHPSSEKLS